MNTMQLQCFLSVAKHLSYIQAAEVIYTTQPVVSYQIKSLEKELEVTLFNRDNRNVALTKAGAYLYAQLEPLSEHIAQIIKVTQKIQKEEGPSFTLLVRRLADYSTLTKIIKRYSDQHPSALMDILTQNELDTSSLLYRDEIQMAFCYEYEIIKEKAIHFYPIDQAHYYVLVAKTHPLTAFKYLTMDDLANEKVILSESELQKDSALFDLVKMRQKKIIVQETSASFDGMLLTVQSGVGCTILPCSRTKRFAGLIKIPLKDVEDIQLGLAWIPSKVNFAAKSFLNTAQIFLQTLKK